ncbi:hypothetical protein QZH41_015629 [Actinostola sp. cb2023]|nr:hypothetical protein QZH41_015629 [Actinostola sp. cb2023]
MVKVHYSDVCKSELRSCSKDQHCNDDKSTESLDGYVHLISPIKTSQNKNAKYFDMKLQTSKDQTVRMVCYSPEKRQNLHSNQLNKTPVTITQLKKNARIYSTMEEEYTINKRSIISPVELDYQHNSELRLHYMASTNAGLCQGNMTWCHKIRGSEYNWIVDLYERLNLPIVPSIVSALQKAVRERASALEKNKSLKRRKARGLE